MNHCLNGSSISNDYRIVSLPCTTSGGCIALRMGLKRPPLELPALAFSHPHHSSPDTPPFLGCSKPPSLFLPYNLCFPPPVPFWHLLLQAHHTTTSFVAAFCSTHHLLQGDVSHHKMQSTHHCSSPRSTLFITFITAGNHIYTSIHPTGTYRLLSIPVRHKAFL